MSKVLGLIPVGVDNGQPTVSQLIRFSLSGCLNLGYLCVCEKCFEAPLVRIVHQWSVWQRGSGRVRTEGEGLVG